MSRKKLHGPPTVEELKRIAKGNRIHITFGGLVDCAKGLKSEDSENCEYDRALVELVGDALGTTQEGYPAVAELLGINPKVFDAKPGKYASYKTKCPLCGSDDLTVVRATLSDGRLLNFNAKLHADGFLVPIPTNLADASTEDETVRCGNCKKEFPLADITL